MSGGYYNYRDSDLKHELFGWTEEGDPVPNIFHDREISEIAFDVLELIHAYDWYVCGDTEEEAWLRAKAAFKQKWFCGKDQRVKRVIDQACDALKKELYETYGRSL